MSYAPSSNDSTLIDFGGLQPLWDVEGGSQRLRLLWPYRFGGVVPGNTWSHVAFTFDGTTSRYYVDGVETAALQSTPQMGGVGAIMGRRKDGGQPLNGKLDEVALFPRALTAAEVQAHMAGPLLSNRPTEDVVPPAA